MQIAMVQEVDGLYEILDSDAVSLIMFTDSEDEETNESRWFMLFHMMVEKSINAERDARVNWAMV